MLLDLLYPPKCPGCRAGVTEHGAWCGVCADAVKDRRQIALTEHKLTAIDACHTLYDYEGSLKRVMHDMKFRQAARYGKHLAWLLERGAVELSFPAPHGVIPVPLHAGRLAERGFNQTELIFKDWAAKRGLEWLDVLVRTRQTQPQWELNLAGRKANIRGAFSVARPAAIAGRNLLLVDDIFTTGLTLNECAKELKKAGAKQVYCLTLASNAR